MEEDIKILEELKEKYIFNNLSMTRKEQKRTAFAINNVLKGYRELEERYLENRQRTIKLELKIKECIPKSKVKEKIEELETKKKRYGFASLESNILLNEIQLLKELMEEK